MRMIAHVIAFVAALVCVVLAGFLLSVALGWVPEALVYGLASLGVVVVVAGLVLVPAIERVEVRFRAGDVWGLER